MNDSDTPSPHVLLRLATLPLKALKLFTGPWNARNALSWAMWVGGLCTVWWLFCQPFYVPTDSMYPTINGDERFFVGDRVLVNKFVFGPRVPFLNKRIVRLAEPQRWDVVVFRAAVDEPSEKVMIKRVVGLPGERIHISEGKIQVNGVPIEPPEPLRDVLQYTRNLAPPERGDLVRVLLGMAKDEVIPNIMNPSHAGVRALMADIERIHLLVAELDVAELTPQEMESLVEAADPRTFDVLRDLVAREQQMARPFRFGISKEDAYAIVPEDSYLMLGDNSGHSLDGRYFGWVNNDHILGRAFCVWWPLPRLSDLSGFTRVWWCQLLLAGIPLALIGVEICAYRRKRHKRGV